VFVKKGFFRTGGRVTHSPSAIGRGLAFDNQIGHAGSMIRDSPTFADAKDGAPVPLSNEIARKIVVPQPQRGRGTPGVTLSPSAIGRGLTFDDQLGRADSTIRDSPTFAGAKDGAPGRGARHWLD